MSASPRPRAVLVIAASDSSGGAGLSRDVQALHDFHASVRCALTAVTAQSNAGVRRVQPLAAELLRAQLDAALEDGPPGAIKIGMLATATAVQVLADWLPPRDQVPVVLDPVLRSSSGTALLEAAAVPLLKALLLPRVSLLTPNLSEAAALLDDSAASSPAQCRRQLAQLLSLGPAAVLLKGGHAEVHAGEPCVTDWLATAQTEPLAITTARVQTQRRGTGCSLASAIAAQLASGVPLPQACARAQGYVAELLRTDGLFNPSMQADRPSPR